MEEALEIRADLSSAELRGKRPASTRAHAAFGAASRLAFQVQGSRAPRWGR